MGVVAVHHAIVIPTSTADEELRETGFSQVLHVLERVRQLEDFRYRHAAPGKGFRRRLERLEHHVADAVIRHALPLELELHNGSGEPLGSIARYAVVRHLERHTQHAAAATRLQSVLPALVHVVARARRHRQVFEGVPQSSLEASGEAQDDVRKSVVSWQAVAEGEGGDVDFDCVQTFQDRLGFVVAGFAGAEDL